MKTLFYLSFLCFCLCACNPSNPSKQQPIKVNINKDSSLVLGETFRLDASKTPAPSSASYRWSIATTPQESQAKVVAHNSSIADFTPDVVGDYLLHVLVATESEQAHETVQLRVKADDSNSPPIVKKRDIFPLQLRAVVGEEREIELEPYDIILNEVLPWFFDYEDRLTNLHYSVKPISEPTIATFNFPSRNVLSLKAVTTGTTSFMIRATDSEGLFVELPAELQVHTDTDNKDFPIIGERPEDLVVSEGSGNRTIDISNLFSDSKESTLNYDVWVKDSSIVTATLQGTQLELDFKLRGSTTITLRATNNAGLFSHSYFHILVE